MPLCLKTTKDTPEEINNTVCDKIENFNGSIVQHGKYNDRIYLMKVNTDNIAETFDYVNALQKKYSYSKIFAKIPQNNAKPFLDNGFTEEAKIPGFYNTKQNALFLCKYYNSDRKKQSAQIKNKIDSILKTAKSKPIVKKTELSEQFNIKKLDASNAEDLALLYAKVFASYPFPIDNPDYIKQTMQENFYYFGIFANTKLVAASSAEMDTDNANVEMTDFATHPDFRGRNFAIALLDKMEKEMERKNFKTFFTIARALSFGMNITFAKMGYEYTGTLINNTNISGQIESMNVWFKSSI